MPAPTTLALSGNIELAERTRNRHQNSPTLGNVREIQGMLETHSLEEVFSKQC